MVFCASLLLLKCKYWAPRSNTNKIQATNQENRDPALCLIKQIKEGVEVDDIEKEFHLMSLQRAYDSIYKIENKGEVHLNAVSI